MCVVFGCVYVMVAVFAPCCCIYFSFVVFIVFGVLLLLFCSSSPPRCLSYSRSSHVHAPFMLTLLSCSSCVPVVFVLALLLRSSRARAPLVLLSSSCSSCVPVVTACALHSLVSNPTPAFPIVPLGRSLTCHVRLSCINGDLCGGIQGSVRL